jgi:hypothetical protein
VRSTDELGYEDDEESMSDFEPEHAGDEEYREKIVH